MIIRRRLLEADPAVSSEVEVANNIDAYEQEFKKANTEQKGEILNKFMKDFVYKNEEKYNKLFDQFKKLPLGSRINWITNFGFKSFRNNYEPFLAVLKNTDNNNFILSNANYFLRCYNISVSDIFSYNDVNGKLGDSLVDNNIIFIKDLYNQPDFMAIARLYYREKNKNYNEKLEEYKNSGSNEEIKSLNDYNDIFYDQNKNVRDYKKIEYILSELNSEFKNRKKTADEITSKDEVSDELKDIVTKISKNAKQKEYVLNTLQQK